MKLHNYELPEDVTSMKENRQYPVTIQRPQDVPAKRTRIDVLGMIPFTRRYPDNLIACASKLLQTR